MVYKLISGWFRKEETHICHFFLTLRRNEKETEIRKRKQERERKMRTERNLASSVFLVKQKCRRGKVRVMESWERGGIYQSSSGGPSLRY